MTITYYPSIPSGTHTPAQDYANMATNTDAVSTIIGVDHITFNTANGGMHKQVQFPSSNVPADPTPPAEYTPTLFTFADAFGIDQLKYFTGSTSQSKDQYLIGANQGSVMLFGGVIVKWGQGTIGGSPITFTKAFPHTIFQVYVSTYSTNDGYVTVNGGTVSTAGFTPVKVGSGTGTYAWLAIGN